MPRITRRSSPAFSLLELLVTTAIMSLLVTAVSIALRSSQQTWEGHASDYQVLQARHAVIRHLVRQVRQATHVVSISSPKVKAGSLILQMRNGEQYTWTLQGKDVVFSTPRSTGLLAEGIGELSFTGYESDGTTQTAVATDIRSLRVRTSVEVSRGTNSKHSASSRVWLRSW